MGEEVAEETWEEGAEGDGETLEEADGAEGDGETWEEDAEALAEEEEAEETWAEEEAVEDAANPVPTTPADVIKDEEAVDEVADNMEEDEDDKDKEFDDEEDEEPDFGPSTVTFKKKVAEAKDTIPKKCKMTM